MRLIYNILKISSSKIKKIIFYFNRNNTDIFRSKLYKYIHGLRSFYTKLDQLNYRSKTLKTPLNGGNNLWQQYKLEFTSVPRHSIINNLQIINPDLNDIVIVPTIYLKYLKKKFKTNLFDTLSPIDNLEKFKRLIWATDRCDKGAEIVSEFYKKKKEVISFQFSGPSKSYMHDSIKENILIEELNLQRKEKIDKFSHGTGADFSNLMQALDNAKYLDGSIVEIGCFEGSSTCITAKYMSKLNINKKYYIYDVFEGFNYPEVKNSSDQAGWINTHKTSGRDNVYKRVSKRWSFDPNNLKVTKKNILDKDALKEVESICFANIDVDIYDAVKEALLKVDKKLVKNGMILVEDAGHTPWLLGAKVALEDFLRMVNEKKYIKLQFDSGQYLLIKK